MKQQLNPIECYADTKIYLFCPAGYATGGPEALHQLGAQLRAIGFNAFMYYYTTPDSVDVVHKNYEKYQVPVADALENNSHNIIILPETHLAPIFDKAHKQIRKIIWWLSVVNYHIIQNGLINSLKHKNFFWLRNYFGRYPTASFARLKRHKDVWHISHSWYSQVHLLENGIEPVGRISDYMNNAFFDSVDQTAAKENIVIYNPVKNDKFLEQIISLTPTLNWMPIKDMTPAQVATTMNKAKLYIDFGFHPGKERMPREACIMHCCMIIGKNGSAAYAEDMPIPERYRFDKNEDQIAEIIIRINQCFENYDILIADFAPYREALYNEQQEFEAAVKKVFVKA